MNVFGTLSAQGNFGTFVNVAGQASPTGAGAANQYNVVLHPGSTLRIDNNTGLSAINGTETSGNPTITSIATTGLTVGMAVTGTNIPNNTFIVSIDSVNGNVVLSNAPTNSATTGLTFASNNRFDDATGLFLNGASVTLSGLSAGSSVETIGALSFDKGAHINVTHNGTNGQAELDVASLSRIGHGTLVFAPTSGNFGAGTVPGGSNQTADRVVVLDNNVPNLNGASPAYYVDATTNQYVLYSTPSATVSGNAGFADTTGETVVSTANFPTTGITSASRVSVTAATTLLNNVFAQTLRTNNNINNGTGQFNTINLGTVAGSGGLLSYGTVTIQPNIVFGTTASPIEGLIYIASGTTTQLSGDLTASAITKFGAGTLQINKDQSDAARGNGQGYSNGWWVNEGTLTINAFGGLGNAVASNTVTLDGSSQTSAAGTTLLLQANPGSVVNATYTSGKIIAVDNAIISVNNQINDSTTTISAVELQSTDTTGLVPSRLRFSLANLRQILNTGVLTISGGPGIIDVNATAIGNGQISTGVESGVAVAGLAGSQQLIKWGNGVLYIRGDNRTSFTGSVSVEQGALSVTNPNAFASTTAIAVHRGGVFDLQTSGFTNVPTYDAGSAERWSAEGARNGTLNLQGATLQVNSDEFTTHVAVTLNGGSIEGFERTDDIISNNSGAIFRTLGTGVTFNVAGNSFLGQDGLQDGPNGIDNGRSATNNPVTTSSDTNSTSGYTDSARGVILEIKGNISGVGGLTKQGTDTVILSGTNTFGTAATTAGTTGLLVQEGVLRVGSATAIPNGINVRTDGDGVLDLATFNATVGTLSTLANNPGGDGFISNSGTTLSVLTVGQGATGSWTYGGIIQNNVSLVKVGTGTMTLTGANTYLGDTVIGGGALRLDPTTGSINPASNIKFNGGTFAILTGATSTENVGVVSFLVGDNTFQVGGGDAVQAAGLNRAIGATGTIVEGTAASFKYTGSPTGFIDQGTFLSDGTNTNYAYVDSGTGAVRAINYLTDSDATSLSSGDLAAGSGKHVQFTGLVSDASTVSVNTLKFAAGSGLVLISSGSVVNLTRNGISKTGGDASVIIGNGHLGVAAGTDLVVRTDAGSSLEIDVPISGGASNALTKSGPGTLILASSNTLGGTTYLNSGTLQIGNGGTVGALPTGPVIDSGSLVFNRSDSVTIPNAISGTGTVSQSGSGSTNLTGSLTYTGVTNITQGNLTVTAAGATSGEVISGGINGVVGASFNKAGNGTLSVFFNGKSGGVTNHSAVDVLSGTLKAIGSTAGNLSVESGGVLAPTGAASEIGNFAVGGNLAFNSGSALTIDLSGSGATINGDTITASTISLANDNTVRLNLNLDSQFAPTLDTGFALANVIPTGGTFANLQLMSFNNAFGGPVEVLTDASNHPYMDANGDLIAYSPNGVFGNNTFGSGPMLLAVPEPSGLASLVLGLSALVGLRRFRRRRA